VRERGRSSAHRERPGPRGLATHRPRRIRNGLGRKSTSSRVRADPPERTRSQVDMKPSPFRNPERTRLDAPVERSPFRTPARTRPEVDIQPSPCRIPERTPLYPRVNASPFRPRPRGASRGLGAPEPHAERAGRPRSRTLCFLACLGRPRGAPPPGVRRPASGLAPARGRPRDPPAEQRAGPPPAPPPPSWPALAGREALLPRAPAGQPPGLAPPASWLAKGHAVLAHVGRPTTRLATAARSS